MAAIVILKTGVLKQRAKSEFIFKKAIYL